MKHQIEIVEYEPKIKQLVFEEGDLVLVESRKKPKNFFNETLILGVINCFNEEDQHLSLEHVVKLHKDTGGFRIPLVFPCYRGSSHEHDYFVYLDGQYQLDFYIGQNEVLDELRRREGFEFHLDWISKLEKPYLRGARENA